MPCADKWIPIMGPRRLIQNRRQFVTLDLQKSHIQILMSNSQIYKEDGEFHSSNMSLKCFKCQYTQVRASEKTFSVQKPSVEPPSADQ